MAARLRTLLHPATFIALVALFVALGGPSFAGDGFRALTASRARDADTVDRIHASRKPRPNRLLALDRRGKFPASVLALPTVTGPTGPQGATGAQGVPGARGEAGPKGEPGPPTAPWAAVRHWWSSAAPALDGAAKTIDSTTVTLPAAGRLLARYDARSVTMTCAGGGAMVFALVTAPAGGTPTVVPDSAQLGVSGTAFEPAVVQGISAAVPAGAVDVRLVGRCASGGGWTGNTQNTPQWSLMLVAAAG